jgi:hypothetical protein
MKQESRSTDAAAFSLSLAANPRSANPSAAHSAPNTTATTSAKAAAMANRSIVDVQAIVTSVG